MLPTSNISILAARQFLGPGGPGVTPVALSDFYGLPGIAPAVGQPISFASLAGKSSTVTVVQGQVVRHLLPGTYEPSNIYGPGTTGSGTFVLSSYTATKTGRGGTSTRTITYLSSITLIVRTGRTVTYSPRGLSSGFITQPSGTYSGLSVDFHSSFDIVVA